MNPETANGLLDEICDLRASEKMCGRATEWELRIASVPGGYTVHVEVEGDSVVRVEDAWLERGIRRATEEFTIWRATSEADLLANQLIDSLENEASKRATVTSISKARRATR